MKKINLNQDTSIDLSKLIDSRLLVQANSGGGKSWILRRILEQSHGKVQQIIIDPEGEFATLREKYEYILCGKEADVPVNSKSAALLAHRLLEFNTSAIIDLYELHPQERKHFVRLFLEALVNSPKELWHPVIVVIDEAHTFVPEKGDSEASDSVIGLASLGRKRGFCAILATQRISKLHKDAAAECNNKLIGRTSLDIDRKRASEELGFVSKEQVLSLRSLQPGEFYAFGPALSSDVIKVKVGEVETTHPKAGFSRTVKLAPPTEAIKEVLSKLSDLPAEAAKEAQTVAELKKENADLKRQNTRKKEVSGGFDQKFVENATKHAILRRDREWKGVIDDVKKQFDDNVVFTLALVKDLEKIKEISSRVAAAPKPKKIEIHKIPMRYSDTAERPVVEELMITNFPIPQKMIRDHFPKSSELPENGNISSPQQRILDTIAWIENLNSGYPAKKNQTAFLSDQSPTSSGYANNLSALRSAGLISYPSVGFLALTEAGRVIAKTEGLPLDTNDLHRMIKQKVSNPQWRILETLISSYPEAISKEELAGKSGQSFTSSGYANNLSSLRTLGLIDYPEQGMVIALKSMFIQ